MLMFYVRCTYQPRHSPVSDWIVKTWCGHTVQLYSAVQRGKIIKSAEKLLDLELTVLIKDTRL